MIFRPKSRDPRGFTLIEVLIVILIIAILATLILAAAKSVQNKGKRSRAEGEIAAIAAALESYKADNGDYPSGGNVTTTNGTNVTTNPASNSSVLVQTLMPSSGKVYYEFRSRSIDSNNNLVDPWGTTNRYYYQYPGSSNRNGTGFYDLWSTAGDTSGTTTNSWIKNW